MKIVINPKYKELSQFIISVPTIFETEGILVYEARNKLKSYQVNGYDIIVKSFKKPLFINRLIYTSFRPSKAKRSYEYAFKLLKKDICTPEPIAYIEEMKDGLLNRSYFISIYEKKAEHIRTYMSGEIKDDEFITYLGKFIADFHSKGIYHLDMSPGNILSKKFNNEVIFMLVDINRMKFKKNISEKKRYRSFRRLSNNSEVINIMAKEYTRLSNLNEEKGIIEIKKECSKFFKMNI